MIARAALVPHIPLFSVLVLIFLLFNILCLSFTPSLSYLSVVPGVFSSSLKDWWYVELTPSLFFSPLFILPLLDGRKGVMNGKLQADKDTRNIFFRAVLPSLQHFCEAFPLLLEGCMELLLRVNFGFAPAAWLPGSLSNVLTVAAGGAGTGGSRGQRNTTRSGKYPA